MEKLFVYASNEKVMERDYTAKTLEPPAGLEESPSARHPWKYDAQLPLRPMIHGQDLITHRNLALVSKEIFN
ncbi:unnamed protein product [Pieris brassicae]|uniref:Uncharacterized protein n=1 Tax=Pieris brassicae TaxID=7116 RepID=A0A9P0T3K1_PIEBR|nr:unnamed protein product [Pieris brassicae]